MTHANDRSLPFAPLKLTFSAFLAIFALSLVNEIFELRLAGDHDWEAILAVIAVGSVAMALSVASSLRR